MGPGSLLERLSAHKTLRTAPQDELAWVAGHGHLHRIAKTEILTPKEGPVKGLHVVLEGHLAIHVDKGAGPRKVMEWHAGDVTGVLPYSRIVAPPADVLAQEPTEVVTVYREDLDELVRECPQLTGILVHVMVDRARHFTSSFLHDEKLVSLGKLAAGLAHELNNPASAIARSADALSQRLVDLATASRSLSAAGLTEDQLTQLSEVCDQALALPVPSLLSPLEQEEREDWIADWLEDRRADRTIAETLAETPITMDMLKTIGETVQGEALEPGLRWVASALGARSLGAEIRTASARVSDLVDAVKGFTQMDRASLSDLVDVPRDLSNTLVVVGAKAKQKSIALRTDMQPELPLVRGSASELNQVWSNLIDNALDAVPEQGHVDVVVRREGDNVTVRVVDDGPGIPPEIRERVFDPFFTTKPVGAGTGLGLDIVRRLIQRHGGQIEMESSDRGTEFLVQLPIASADS